MRINIRKAASLFFLVLIFALSFQPAFAAESFPVDAKSAVLMEASSGTLLLSKDPDGTFPPASVTKVMTVLLVYEALEKGAIKPDEPVIISEHAASMGGSQVFLEPNEEQTVENLLKCVIIASANDAAVALAEKVSGSEEAFVNDMNQKAKELGMKSTSFKNACGLDIDGHITSARDIALMTRELINKYPQVFKYTKVWQDTITHNTRRGSEEFGLTNTNKLIKMYPSATGLKTGSTSAALFCLSATAEKDDMTLIATVMGSPTSKIRFAEAVKMLDNGFSNYSIKKGDSAGTKKGSVKVYKGEKNSVEAIIKEEIKALTKKGEGGELTSEIKLDEYVDAPIEKDMKLGVIVYKFGDKVVGESELVSAEAIKKLGLGGTLKRLVGNWL